MTLWLAILAAAALTALRPPIRAPLETTDGPHRMPESEA